MRIDHLTIIASACGHLAAGVALAQSADKAGAKQVEKGESVYAENCQSCHGENLVSPGQIADLRDLEAKDRARFQLAVENGKGRMPPWKGVISAEEIDAIWAYIMARR